MRIALFTPFSPSTGGGGVIFRSLLPNLQGAEIQWFYLAKSKTDLPGTTHLGPLVMGGPIVRDGMNSIKLFVLQKHPKINEYVKALLAWSPDIVWINAMNEGLLIGKELLDAGVRHLHVTVHDDPEGLAQKSNRYRVFAALFERRNRELLKRAHSVDVVCDSMRGYYQKRVGVDSGVVYRYIRDFNPPVPVAADDASTITIGHVGSAYSAPEVFAFASALRGIAQVDGIKFRLINFGISPAMTAAEKEFPDIVKNLGNVAEPNVIQQLQACRFVYSMYSFSPRNRIFRETSQPTKMSTYLMAARPILAHCPPGSSTTDMLAKFKLGLCVESMDTAALTKGIREMLNFQLEREEARRAAEYYCGQRNLDYLNACFGIKRA